MVERAARRAVVLPVLGIIAFWAILALVAISLGARGWGGAAVLALMEGGMLWGLIALGHRVGWPARRIFGQRPRLEAFGSAISVSIPLIALEIGLIWITMAGLSRIAPDLTDTLLRIAESDVFEFLGTGTASMVYKGVILCGLVPITEEFAFRGLIFHRLAERSSTGRAVVLSSILFAVLHFDPVGKFLFSVACCLLYLGTRSLWAPITLHAANNLIAVLSPDVDVSGRDPILSASSTEWIAGLAILAVGIAWAAYYARTHWHLLHWLPPGLEEPAPAP